MFYEKQKIKFESESNDYALSANALFHFMKKEEYLFRALEDGALRPRYCTEDIEYLNIKNRVTSFKKIMVLEKCFCDIPLHKITESIPVRGFGDEFDELSPEDKRKLSDSSTHIELYGEYGIAFSKEWGEKHGLQPVHYLNPESEYTREFSKLIAEAIDKDDFPDVCADDVIRRLAYIKPLRGAMSRKFERSDKKVVTVNFRKNFHDEQEWRYVPKKEEDSKTPPEIVLANPNLLEKLNVDLYNAQLEKDSYRFLWLRFDYQDLRYIIVPNKKARDGVIDVICRIPDTGFAEDADVNLQKYRLISKILVLEEIGKDW